MNKEFFRKIYAILPGPLEKLCLKFENAIIYIFYGALTTILNYVVHFGLRLAFTDFSGLEERTFSSVVKAMEGSAIPSSAATVIAWIVSLIFAFFVNKFFVFESKNTDGVSITKQFASFTGGRLFSFSCELLIMFVFVDLLHFNEILTKLASNVIVLILNYVFSKFIVFKEKNANK